MEYALKIENLCKTYPKSDFQLKNVSFNIPSGAIMGFVGRNGAGKSTTVNTMLNIIFRDSGDVLFFGESMTDKSPSVREDIGVVFDAMNFSGELTAHKLEKVLAGIYKNWDTHKYSEYLARFDVPPNNKIKTFSRGMTMKLSLSVALSHSAKLLILDEATAGLDPVVREEILDVFLEFVEDENHSILISSHISSDIEKIADYITFIDGGCIILTEKKDVLLYEYGIARMKQVDFTALEKGEYIAWRKRGLHIEALVRDKKCFMKAHPDIIVDDASIDAVLPLITKEVE